MKIGLSVDRWRRPILPRTPSRCDLVLHNHIDILMLAYSAVAYGWVVINIPQKMSPEKLLNPLTIDGQNAKLRNKRMTSFLISFAS